MEQDAHGLVAAVQAKLDATNYLGNPKLAVEAGGSEERLAKVYKPLPHPYIKSPTLEQIRNTVAKYGLDRTVKALQVREDKIAAEKVDPYRHGYELPHWKQADELLSKYADVIVLGGNRSSKSEYAAKRIVQTLCKKPGAVVWCLHTTNQSSVTMQQPLVHKYLPHEFKTAKKTKVTNVGFTVKNGFSENRFVLPNRSMCIFMNYSQDRSVIEGGEVDAIWCDELVPIDWIETLRYRLVTRMGYLLTTFTPVDGFSATVAEYLDGARITETAHADLLPDTVNVPGLKRGEMPVIAESMDGKKGIMWFHSKNNGYSPWHRMVADLKGQSPYVVKIRAYGYADKLQGTQFPRFTPTVHVIKQEAVPEKGTNYFAIDPAGSRNWFMLWLRVDAKGRCFVYREWPDVSSVGEWALPGEKQDGKPGIAQTNGAGMGVDGYKALIRRLEGKEEVFARYIDPRAGATQAIGHQGGTSIIDMFAAGDDPMILEPSAGIQIEEGVAMINDRLTFDVGQPISTLNEPRLFVSDNCKNLIYSLTKWTGADGLKGACKDPIDVLRYIIVMDPSHFDGNSFRATGGGTY
jgi:phage terminase large subunit-like protein